MTALPIGDNGAASRGKGDIALRGMEHFMPLIEAFKAFMIAVEETPMELVDPDVLRFLDNI